MKIRLHEIHPSLTHYPLVLLPTALGLDIAGNLLDNEQLTRAARLVTPIAATAAGVTAATGLIAEQEVRGDDEAYAMLDTHRNINLSAVAVSSAMCIYRLRRPRPGWGYLSLGIGLMGAVSYSAYLGGRMVYGKGLGVESADGVRHEEAPTVGVDNLGEVLRTAGRQFLKGLRQLVERPFSHLEIAPEAQQLQRSIDAEHDGPGPVPEGP